MVMERVPFHNFWSHILAGTEEQMEDCPQKLDFSKEYPLKLNSLI